MNMTAIEVITRGAAEDLERFITTMEAGGRGDNLPWCRLALAEMRELLEAEVLFRRVPAGAAGTA